MKTAIFSVIWAINALLIAVIINHSGGTSSGTTIVILALYFLPTIIAAFLQHRNSPAILVFNLFLGWTFLGWILALVWSFADGGEAKRTA